MKQGAVAGLYWAAGLDTIHSVGLSCGPTIGRRDAKAPGTGDPGVGGRWQQGGLHHHEVHGFGLPAHPCLSITPKRSLPWHGGRTEQCLGAGNEQRGWNSFLPSCHAAAAD